jgi:hypothetical protein
VTMMILTLMFAAFLQTAAPPGDGKAISMKIIDKGSQSNVEEPRQVTVRTAEELAKLWRAHAPDRPLPTVDFSRDMIVGVFLGSRPTAGYNVEIVSAREEQGALVVRYRAAQPPRNAITAQILTMPYQLVAVPRHVGDVRFEKVD